MLHVVLYEPEIPQNTGNIIRTCMATGSRLHLIEPLGFSLDEKHLRRSGMDYIKDADIHIHKDWNAFVAENPCEHYYFMTRYGKKAPSEFDFTKEEGDVYLVLGKSWQNGAFPRCLHPGKGRCSTGSQCLPLR